MNNVSLLGRLTKEVEMRYTSTNNTAVASMTLAVDRQYKQEGQPDADFVNCIIWQKKGEAAAKYLEKGRRIAVVGRIQTRTWDDTEGKKHYVTEVVVENWYFADDKKKEESGSQGQQSQQGAQQNNKPPAGGRQSKPAGDRPPWMN